jgi:hypothetical protein
MTEKTDGENGMEDEGRTEEPARMYMENDTIINYLLKEKGLTRQQVGKQIWNERIKKERDERAEEEAEAKRVLDELEAKRTARALQHLNERMIVMIDGVRLASAPAQDLDELLCPYCNAPNQTVRHAVLILSDHIEFPKIRSEYPTLYDQGSNLPYVADHPTGFELSYPLPAMRGTVRCGCGKVLELVITTTAPRKASDD